VILHAVVYCDFRNPHSQASVNVLRALLGQFCLQLGKIPEALLKEYKKCNRGALYSDPDLDFLEHCLTELSQQHRLFIFIDALEESNHGYELTETLRHLLSRAKQMNIFVTSRNDLEIQKALDIASRVRFEDHVAEIDNDIRLYISGRLESDRDLQLLRYSNVQRMVVDSIHSKSLGM
jgi:hypothetical protein